MLLLLLENQVIRKKWNRHNRKWYQERGYIFTNYSDYFEVRAEDLSIGANDKVMVKCDYCGIIVSVVWRDYINYKYEKYACKHCRQKKTAEVTLHDRVKKLYESAKEFCDKYDYKILTPINEIKDSDSRVDYLCPKHGIHNVKIYNLITKHRCVDCMHEKVAGDHNLSLNYLNDYIEEHDSKWLNQDCYTRSIDKNMILVCPMCGQPFLTSFYSFRKHDGQFCPECTNLESKGERKIRLFLEEHNIVFEPQYRFVDCRTSVPLPFDFYIDKLNICIEYDGEGHYQPIRRGSITQEQAEQNLIQIQYRDKIKTEYCLNNNITLIRIPYWDFENIESILDEKISNLHGDIV